MATIKRILGGLKAKRAGQAFESQFESLCRIQGIKFVRIPDSCKRIHGNRLIRVKSPFDYCLCFGSKCAHVDTKSTKANTFIYSMLDWHQLNELNKLAGGGPAGYVIQLGDGKVWFAPIDVLRETKPGSSVNLNKCKLLGMKVVFDVSLIFS